MEHYPNLMPQGRSMHGGGFLPDLNDVQKATFSIYKALSRNRTDKEIRLLSIHPGKGPDQITCSLEVVALDDFQGRFLALSYVWGDVEHGAVRAIALENRTTEIGLNLHCALSHIRRPSKPTLVWVDFLCIDQTNVNERNHQVGLMKDIYTAAAQVVIWLGERERSSMTTQENFVWNGDDSDTKAVKRCLSDYDKFTRTPLSLQNNTRDFFLAAMSLLSLLATGLHLSDIAFLKNHFYRSQTLLELKYMMLSEWWQRIWVVQETVLPRKATVYYGFNRISWEMLGRAARNWELHRRSCCAGFTKELPPDTLQFLSDFGSRVLDIELIRASLAHRHPILLRDLLWQFRERNASDFKDKVFALTGLAQDDPCAFVDYSLTIFQVFRRVVEDSILHSGSLAILMGCAERRAVDLPSWMPDWRIPFEPYTMERLSRVNIYNASNGLLPGTTIRNHRGRGVILALEAITCSIVTAVSPLTLSAKSVLDLSETSRTFQQWQKLARSYYLENGFWLSDCLEEDVPYVGGGSLREAFLRTLCADTIYSGNNISLLVSDDQSSQSSRSSSWWHRVSKRLESRTGRRRNFEPVSKMDSLASTAQAIAAERYENARSRSTSHTEGETRPKANLLHSTSASKSASQNSFHRELYDRAPMNYIETMENCDLSYMAAIDHAVRSATTCRKFFLTPEGYIGLGPTDTEVGDSVVVLPGANTPFILRDHRLRDQYDRSKLTSNQPDSYFMVGDCFLHGAMYGELAVANSHLKKVIHLI